MIASPGLAAAQTPTGGATAEMHMASGESFATATFRQAAGEVLISISFRNRTALVGTHAIHIHSVARCDPPTFDSAGGIFNPFGKQHGLLNPDGPMGGDLPSLVITRAGVSVYNLSAPLVTLGTGSNGVLRSGGTSLVVFSQPDDDQSQPEGNAGQRVACGVIQSTGASAAAAFPRPAGSRPDLLSALLILLIGGLLIFGGIMLRRRSDA